MGRATVMSIDDVIDKLQEIREEEGNLPCVNEQDEPITLEVNEDGLPSVVFA